MVALQNLRAYLGQFSRDLWILSLGWFVGAVGFAASVPFVSIYFNTELGMSTIQIGVFFGVLALVRAAFQALGGELSDHIGRQGLLTKAQFYRAFTFVGLGLSIKFHLGFWPIALMLLLNSIFGSIFMTTLTTMVADIVPKEKRLDGYAISRSAGNAGWAVGPAIGGYLAASSYAELFYFAAVLTVLCAMIFHFLLKVEPAPLTKDSFRLADLMSIRKDKLLLVHGILTLGMYLVVAQLVAPLAVYAVGMVGLNEQHLGYLFTINGLMVVLFQIPVTRLTARWRLTTMLAAGGLFYFVGYSLLGVFAHFEYFVIAIMLATLGELLISPPMMTLTSRMAPEGRIGRYMGVHGFFVTAGWSLGPLWGGMFLDWYDHSWSIAWVMISSLALVSAAGYLFFSRRLPAQFNNPQHLLDND